MSIVLQDTIHHNETCSYGHFWAWLSDGGVPYTHHAPYRGQSTTSSFRTYPLQIFLHTVAFAALCGSLVIWHRKYRLRYLLRLSCLVFLSMTCLRIVCGNRRCEMLSTPLCRGTHGARALACWISGCLCFLLLCVRYRWSLPLDIDKNLLDVDPFSQQSPRRRGRRDPGQVPPVFPNGWIPLTESHQVQAGKTLSISALGHRFCAFRGETGQAYVLDAYCPHLGADLSAGGRVLGECIECPFHGWRFNGGDGRCVRIPYAQKVPEVARAKTWHSCERNGFLFVWHHAEGEEPTWEMPPLDDIESGRWKFRGRTSHEVRCHIQEIPENGADVAHLHQVHSRSVLMGPNWMSGPTLFNFIRHEWQPNWDPDQDRPHVGTIHLRQSMRCFGYELPCSTIHLDIRQIGPATVHLHLSTWFGRGVLLQHIVPTGPLRHRVVHLLYTEGSWKQFPADLLLMGEAVMLERDIAVWNNKKFLRNPVLVREDKLISRYRRWYSQFYSEHSPTLKEVRERSLDW